MLSEQGFRQQQFSELPASKESGFRRRQFKKVQKNLFICHIKCDDKNCFNIEPIWLPVHNTAVVLGLQWLINDNEVEAQNDGWFYPSIIKTFFINRYVKYT